MNLSRIVLTIPCDECKKEIKFIGKTKEEADDKMIRHCYDHDHSSGNIHKNMSYKKYREIFLEVYNKVDDLK